MWEQCRDMRQAVMCEHSCHVRQARIYWEHWCEARGAYMAKCALGKTETWRDSAHSRDRHGETAQTAGGPALQHSLGNTHVCPREDSCMPRGVLGKSHGVWTPSLVQQAESGPLGAESWSSRSRVMASPSLLPRRYCSHSSDTLASST